MGEHQEEVVWNEQRLKKRLFVFSRYLSESVTAPPFSEADVEKDISLIIVGVYGQVHEKLQTCEPGFFPCGNLTQCVAQEFQCDDVDHCPNAADEKNCEILEGWNEDFDVLHRVSVGEVKFVNECALAYYPDGCTCKRLTLLACSNLSLSRVPPGIPSNVTRLHLKYNEIEHIDNETFANFPSLVFLNLLGNRLQEIPRNSFGNLHQVTKLYLSENNISSIERGAFLGLNSLNWLFLQGNSLRSLEAGMFSGLEQLYWLDLRDNKISDLKEGKALKDIKSIAWIDLEGNEISSIDAKSFASNISINVLILNNNVIKTVDRDAFRTQVLLKELDMSNNQISELPDGVFDHLEHLQILRLGNNPVTTLPMGIFDNLSNLIDLNLTGIVNANISAEMFENLETLKQVGFAKFEYCRYVPHVRTCEPRSDGISSFENLLKNVVLRVFVWTIGIITSLGNLGVLVSRAFMKAENKVHTVVVTNLCAADFLMGVYLLIIGTQDVRFRDEYNKHALQWTNSHACKISGFLAMVSSEVSVLTLMFISLERYFIIVYPYSFQRIKAKRAIAVLAFIWSIGTMLAWVPIVAVGYFGNFYGSNGVCFPLHLHDPGLQGWEYSAFVFLGINTTAFGVIVVSYIGMFLSIRRTRRAAAQCGIKGDMTYAKRFLFIILTDSLCWLPIAVLKVMSLCNYIISETLYGWIVVFVLPINSALNPILYTISTTPFAMWFMRQLKRGKFRTSGCYVGSKTEILEARGRSDSSDGYTSYTNVPKRASCFSTTNVPTGIQLDPVTVVPVNSTSTSTSLANNADSSLGTAPEHTLPTMVTLPTGPNRRRSTPIVLLSDLME
ncbi:relaxin receptor 1-like [Diadema antillarum]|uniref:relaxin receptor 1-like n=1 Tax=Diadema antillarum TaxID=105358 RepID=UPI003A8C755F